MPKEITRRKVLLPAKLEDLVNFALFNTEKLNAIRAGIRVMKKRGLGFAKSVWEQKLSEGQEIGGAVLDAEAIIGELLKETPDYHSAGRGTMKRKKLPEGVTKKFSSQCQQLVGHPDIIEQVKAEAAENEDIPTRSEVLRKIKEKKREESIDEQKHNIGKLKPVEGVFDIIVIDPPWSYGGGYNPDGRRVASPYPEMSIPEIGAIKLPAANNCILWLWTTHRFIWDAKELLSDWGFEYKAILVWDKQKMGMGEWLRMQCEFCLLGIKGKPLWESKSLRDFVSEARTEHSAKPTAFYEMINNNFVGSKLDYFSRKERKGWTGYGPELH